MFLEHSVHSFTVAELLSRQNGTSFCRPEKRAAKLRLLTADLGNRNGPSPKINNPQLKEQPVWEVEHVRHQYWIVN